MASARAYSVFVLVCCSYNVILTIFTYFVPITAMGLSYFQVGVELWGSQGIGECTDHQMENIRSKRRVRFHIPNR